MKRYLIYIVVIFLVSGMMAAQNTDLNVMPKPGPTPIINIAKPQSFKLSNGLTVIVLENHKLPRVNITLTIDKPPVYEGSIAGVSSIMSEQLGSGTMTMSKDDFNKRIGFLGARINFSPTGAVANTLSKYFPEVLGLMADAAINPKFSVEEIQKSKDRAIENLKNNNYNVPFIASQVSKAIAYGKNTARGEFPTEETIKAIKLEDVENNYKKRFTPDNTYLTIVGNIRYKEIKHLVQNTFGRWKKGGKSSFIPKEVLNIDTTEIEIMNIPSSVQSTILIRNLNNLKTGSPDYFAALIGNHILGGDGLATRLNTNLREKNGFTYGANSGIEIHKYYPSEFMIETNVRNEVADKAINEIMKELNEISIIKSEELESAKAKIKGNFIMSLEDPSTISSIVMIQKAMNLPSDFYEQYLSSVDKVTLKDVSNTMKMLILPNQSRIFIAGNIADILKDLEKLGYPIKYYDQNANPIN